MLALSLNNNIKGSLLVALSGTLYGVLGYFGTKLLQENLSINSMLFWRFAIAAVWLTLAARFIPKKAHKKINWSPTVSKALLFAVLTYCGSSVFYFIASQSIGTGIAMVIFFSYPVFVTLFAWAFSNWRFNLHALLSLSAVVVGLLFLKGQGTTSLTLLGILFASIASFCYACYVYGNQMSLMDISTSLQTRLLCIGNAGIFLLLALTQHEFMWPASPLAWFYAIALGVIATAIPIQLLLDGLKYISPIKASILSVLEPVVTVIIGFLFLNETLSLLQVIGIFIVLVGTLFIQFEKPHEAVENI